MFCLVGPTDDDEIEEGAGSFGFSMEAAGADSGDTYPCTYCGIAFVTHHELKVSISYTYLKNVWKTSAKNTNIFFHFQKTL